MSMKKSPPYTFIIKLFELGSSDLFKILFYLWNNSGQGFQITIRKNKIYESLNIGQFDFSRKLHQLRDHNFLQFHETRTRFSIKLLQPSIKAEGKILC